MNKTGRQGHENMGSSAVYLWAVRLCDWRWISHSLSVSLFDWQPIKMIQKLVSGSLLGTIASRLHEAGLSLLRYDREKSFWSAAFSENIFYYTIITPFKRLNKMPQTALFLAR